MDGTTLYLVTLKQQETLKFVDSMMEQFKKNENMYKEKLETADCHESESFFMDRAMENSSKHYLLQLIQTDIKAVLDMLQEGVESK